MEIMNLQEWRSAVSAWKIIKDRMKEDEELEKICREGLIYLSNGKSSKGCGISLTKVFKKGNIDYSKIPELKGVDLEKYRKPIQESWRINETASN
jgi:hypothetical protein